MEIKCPHCKVNAEYLGAKEYLCLNCDCHFELLKNGNKIQL